MIKKIIGTLLTLIMCFSVIGCGESKKEEKTELTTEQKKEIVEDLQKEIEEESVIKLNTKNIKLEDWNNFKNEFNSWKDYYVVETDGYITNLEETTLTLEEINSIMEQYETNLTNYAPKEMKDTIEKLFTMNDKILATTRLINSVDNFDYEGYNNNHKKIEELMNLIDNIINKYDSKIS